jgi:hypothetical protein
VRQLAGAPCGRCVRPRSRRVRLQSRSREWPLGRRTGAAWSAVAWPEQVAASGRGDVAVDHECGRRLERSRGDSGEARARLCWPGLGWPTQSGARVLASGASASPGDAVAPVVLRPARVGRWARRLCGGSRSLWPGASRGSPSAHGCALAEEAQPRAASQAWRHVRGGAGAVPQMRWCGPSAGESCQGGRGARGGSLEPGVPPGSPGEAGLSSAVATWSGRSRRCAARVGRWVSPNRTARMGSVGAHVYGARR